MSGLLSQFPVRIRTSISLVVCKFQRPIPFRRTSPDPDMALVAYNVRLAATEAIFT